ncbi:putative gamma-glutamylcyclotransferase [Helianthus annuus]|uniref:Gamma-glutamylcyclotransferase family protein n=1 Tax=Helianthus annuus TaxID=4232 RepID=A0A251RL92_HELAN|nr:putative gamma-glutamylcyclotransferase At3g02910 [Helianthus annuus]KAF5753592.1 putative gamma-glutamylcyclotransferase [Helianthus annuus]KAJ0445949.1 putative gamma-glutamylcyclotransferase [Helianthus annuus]
MSQQTLIFCYGTLKRGFANHTLIEDLISHNDAVFIGSYVTDLHLPLVQGPYGVPFLLNLPGSSPHRVQGELYSVSTSGLQRLDELEGITLGHYERLPITLRSADSGLIEAEAYYAHRSFAEEMWRKCGEEGYDAYTQELGKGYVRRDLRPNNASLRDAIGLFCSEDPTDSLL